jgi:UDP-N-acetylglucosamine/UDP-N-acetylgalactosamine 4-epimerase
MNKFDILAEEMRDKPRKWLVTGCAGFIGSHLLETLLQLDQTVIGMDNFATGYRRNLDDVRSSVGARQWSRFSFLEADIRDMAACRDAMQGVDSVLHQAALGSVPRSLKDPLTTHDVNVNGFVNILIAARDAGVSSLTYASSSSVYGDNPDLPKVEERTGKPLSPYALTKSIDEMYADIFARCYGFKSVGLRYFNVFGKRQDPAGAYAAVIPRWIAAMVSDQDVFINGDGANSRDFCYIQNVVQANLLAAFAPEESRAQVYNVGVGDNTSLLQLFDHLRSALASNGIEYLKQPVHREQRAGDVLHSQADIGKAERLLGYVPVFRIREGIGAAVPWYVKKLAGLSGVEELGELAAEGS